MTRFPLAGMAGVALLSLGLGCAAPSTPRGPEATRLPVTTTAVRPRPGDALPAHRWKLEIDGVLVGGFQEVAGLGTEAEVVAFRNGDDPVTHKRPGKTKFKNISLKRGFVAADGLDGWFAPEGQAPGARKSGSIIYLDREGNEVLRFAFTGAWPSVAKAADRPKVVMDRDTGLALVYDASLEGEIALTRARHETAKNAIGNIR